MLADGTVVLDVRRLAVTDAHVASGLVELDDGGKAEADQLPAEWDILSHALDDLLDPARRERVIGREDEERNRLRELLAAQWSVT